MSLNISYQQRPIVFFTTLNFWTNKNTILFYSTHMEIYSKRKYTREVDFTELYRHFKTLHQTGIR